MKSKSSILIMLVVLGLIVVLPDIASASEGTGGGLPYESWLTKLRESMTGPVAYAISIIGIIAAGAMLVFGGEISAFMKTIVYVVLVMCFIIGANALMSNLFGRAAEIALANPLLGLG